jgi:hypothetical protein
VSEKGVELFRDLQQAQSDYRRAKEAYEQAKNDLFFARRALDKAQTDRIEYLKNRATAGE